MTQKGLPKEWKNREGLPEYAVRWNWVEDSSDSGFTAVLRVKDEARSLPFSLPGVLRSRGADHSGGQRLHRWDP